ncbi:hypothetical protein IC582_024175 [Cucumis melo]
MKSVSFGIAIFASSIRHLSSVSCGLIYHMMLDEIPNNSPDTGESESQVNERRFLGFKMGLF